VHVTLLTSRILRWFPHFLKICGPLCSNRHFSLKRPQIRVLHLCEVRAFYPQEAINKIRSTRELGCKIHSLIPMASAEYDDSLPFSGASSIPLCYITFPSTLFRQLVFHPPSLHLAIYFLVYLSVLLFPNSYIILYWEFYFLPFSVHAQTNVTCLTLLSLSYWAF